jgi:hypothetical protein
LIDIWGSDLLLAVATQFTVAEIICEYENDIWLAVSLSDQDRHCQN